MGLFEQFPYTNFHELNLDFILRKLKKLEDRMAELDGKMAALESKMDVLQEEMAQLREAMAALVLLVESFRDTLDGHTQELEALNARCDSLESGLAALENSVAALAGRVTAAESGIDALTGRVAIAEVDIAALEGRMATVESDIAALRKNVNDITADITALEGRMATAESDIEKLQNTLNHAEVIWPEFTHNGTIELIGRNVDKQSSIVLGAIRMKHYIGENDEDIIISVNGEDIAPGDGWGRWIMYREDSPAGSLNPGSVLADVIGEGFMASLSSRKKKSLDVPYPLAVIVEPKHVKSGYAYNLVVPGVIKQAIIDNPTKTFVLQFTYIPQSNIT